MQISGKRKKMKLFICLLIVLMNEWYSFCTVILFPSCSDAKELGDVIWHHKVYISIILEVRMLDLRPELAENKCRRRKRSRVNVSSFDGYKGTCLFLAAKESLCLHWKDQRTFCGSAAAGGWASEYGGTDVIIPIAPWFLPTYTDYNSISSSVMEQILPC